MARCNMCGAPFDKAKMKEYIGSKFGYDELEKIINLVGSVCESCAMGVYYAENGNDDELNSDRLSVYEAADIWLSSGKDEDQMFGYTEEELEAALS